ncbi:H-NS histone family protein [Caballeronia sp. LjRoot34]|uniref:H-NS family nucleoid-associated regulatory protein n=1 Tax=Caballeronia sp. LjRoot34 TaxID=3342325 RepID=UPI003ED0420D
MATLEQIQAKMKKLQEQAEAILTAKSEAALNQIRDLIAQHGLSVTDIDAHAGGKRRGVKPRAKALTEAGASTPKFQDPKTRATWSGRGRAPSWIANAKDRSRFLIAGEPATANVTGAVKVGGYLRGPQAAKYADPKTGATWSGHGRAPAWLALAKDRSKFLIANATAEAAAPATAPAIKKAAVKKTAVKTIAEKRAAGA